MHERNLLAAFDNVKNIVHRTPVLSSSQFDNELDLNLYFKCENFQKMGAFKMRGACNAISNIPSDLRPNGVVTHSSGNMAQAVALAAKFFKVPAYIVMPENAPQVKKDAVVGYGAEIIYSKPTIEDRQAQADKLVAKYNASFIHPSNDIHVIYGQATAAIELIEDFNDLDVIIVPVGGGGLLAGTALAVSQFSPNTQVYGAEPQNVDDAKRSFDSGKIEFNKTTDTIADGLRTVLGDINFPIITKYVNDIITVSEVEIVLAMKLIYERMKIVIEPSSAVAFAALRKQRAQFKSQKVGIIISGGNVDLSKLPFNSN